MLFWLIFGIVILVLANKINQMSWLYSREAAGALYPIGTAFLFFAGHWLVFLDEPGFQALGLIMTVCAIVFASTGVLIAVCTAVEVVFDFVSDIVRGKMDE